MAKLDLVGPSEIAELAGVTRHTVIIWRSRNLLPAPVLVTSRIPVYRWSDIEEQVRETGQPLAIARLLGLA